MPTAATKRVVKVTEPENDEEENIQEDTVDEEGVPEEVEETTEDTEPEEYADDEEMWSGGPTFGDLKVWKAKYGEDNVYVSLLSAIEGAESFCIWRTLNRHEYRNLVKKMETTIAQGQISETEATMNNEEDIAATCVLYPPYDKNDRNNTLAGFPKLITNDVMDRSGFVQVEVRQL